MELMETMIFVLGLTIGFLVGTFSGTREIDDDDTDD